MGTMQSDSILARKLNTFVPLTAKELKWLAEIQATPLTVKRGKQLIQEGQTGHKAFVLQAGWACSYKDLPNGNRQIISFPIAAQRPAANRGRAHLAVRHRVPASRGGAAVGCIP
jgi:CRP-like cAMP-binding protein